MTDSQPENPPLGRDALGKMISLHLDGKLSKEQLSQLQRTLVIDESARDFYVELISIHSQLEQIHKGPVVHSESLNTLIRRPQTPSRMPSFAMMTLPAALLVVICVWITSQIPDPPVEKPVEIQAVVPKIVDYRVTVADTHEVRFFNQEPLGIGDHLEGDKIYKLDSGQLELLFITGVKASITAPATFAITGENELNLSAGILMAKVTTSKGKGFTVRTPGGPIRDLGTLFGVEIDNAGTSGVQVFQGEVVLADSRGETVKLTEGNTMRCAAGKDQWLPEPRLSRKFYSVIQENKQALTPNIILLPDEVQNMFGADEYIGKAYLMYSATSLLDRIPNISGPSKLSQHFSVVYFDETSTEWKFPDNTGLISFTPDATDLLLARIDSRGPDKNSITKEFTYFAGTQENIHGITSGYQSGDIQIIPDRFQGEANPGEYTLEGTYFIRNSE
ncbi:FecR family protein [Gimesia sp.]|uniref:FecR family protein n=1 Tax=Gimesia sp. TaxID=2024833 RepID=UPI000C5A0679|nr:FecR family protein [Gimesia sp.]MAX39812.1 hypothetical protein [Gimesia sp.]HAH44050.1 hypothetical protein [Planctomycetaceae bacterium]HBL45571.1 hypothetical protein [Planctomycetaceae bacterium]|tara:strand:+ start:5226 stop:6566 length:1341 start_codon:yes stop_codon:yes gene_type:complete